MNHLQDDAAPGEQPLPERVREGCREPELEPGDELVVRRPERLEAWGRAVVVHLLWVGAGVIALGLQFARVFKGLYKGDAMDLAQLGAHLAAGQGYVTSVLRPVAVALYHRAPAPEVFHAPLYPLILGAVFEVLPETDAVVAGVSAFFFLATLPLVYLLGRKLFDATAGVIGAVLFALSIPALGYAVSGMSVTLWAFLLTLTVYLLYGNPGSLRRSLAAGAVLGLCWLSEYLTIALIIPALVAAYYMQADRRRRHLAWFAVGLVVVTAPWWVRNCRVTGDPFFTLERYELGMMTGTHPGLTLFRSANAKALNLVSLVAASPREMVRKAVLGLGSAYRALPMLVGIYIVTFLVIGMFRPLRAPRPNLVRRIVLLMIAFLVVVGALHNPTEEAFFAVVPLATVLCAGYLVMLTREWVSPGGRRAAAVGLLVALAAYPAMVSWAAPQPKARPDQRNLGYLARALPEKAVVVTDAPWAVAWYARRTAVWLPLGGKDFATVQRAIGVDAIYFSSLLQTYPASEQAQMWQAIWAARAVPPGFALAAALPGGEVLMVSGRSVTAGRVPPAAAGSAGGGTAAPQGAP